ncbi:GumC family protein [Albimonas pacifica]|uniref:Chromosome partitioning ATPase, Mrp family, contains Fe-S cluster n=1 Tax=Albimonas pacifica TaxID=1114924 RepID=A0A1I3IWR6_9RHOB|nr:tyrosine-protein kinase domain-containing protein [Albimonas pacifica]SFI52366.1 Chromosome partitioning ATPase, Mrp family, contains Fe-S cluster [Albimonas pacifica]
MIHRSDGEMHFQLVATMLRRRRLLIAGFMATGLALAVAAGAFLPVRWTAKTQLLQETELRDGVEVADPAALDTLVELLLSPGQLRLLAASLAEDPIPPALEGTAPPALPDYRDLVRGLNVFKERRSRLVGVTYVATDPHLAAGVANRAAELFLTRTAERQRAERSAALAAVQARLATARQELDAAEGALRAHRVEFGAAEGAATDAAAAAIAELNRQAGLTRAELLALDDRRAQGPDGGRAPVSPTRLAQDGAAAPAALREGGWRLAAVAPASQAGPSDDAVRGLAPGAADAPGAGAGAAQAEALRLRLGDIDARLRSLRAAAAAGEAQAVRERELVRAAEAAGEVYAGLLRREAELFGRPPAGPPARVVARATVPESPSSPAPALFVFPALLGFGLVGGMTAIALERADQRLRSARDVEEALEVPCLGLVPILRRARRAAPAAALLPEDPFAPYTEAIRAVAVEALSPSSDAGRPPKVLLVTGAATGVGATTLATSLALYLARLRRRTLLIDLDIRRPGVAAALGLGARTRARTLTREAIVASAAPGLDVLPAPLPGGDPVETLSRPEFRALLSELREAYDCVVIDAAPPAGATETRLLASLADQAILAVRWGATQAPEARAALHGLRLAGGVSAVVARADMRAHARRREPLGPGPRARARPRSAANLFA